jgi:hypothetical protein
LFTNTFWSSWNNIFNTITVYDNSDDWFYIRSWNNNLLRNMTSYGNGGNGIQVQSMTSVTFSWTTDVHDNLAAGIFMPNTSNSTLDWAEVYGHTNNYGIYIINWDGNTVKNIISRNNAHWVYVKWFSFPNQVSNIQAYDNAWDGIYLERVDSPLWYLIAYNNWGDGIVARTVSSQTFSSIEAHDNGWLWFYLRSGSSNTLTFSGSTANNWGQGVFITNGWNNTFNNITSSWNTLNWVYVSYSDDNIFNNLVTNANGEIGLYLSNSDDTIIHTIEASNNGDYWIRLASSSNTKIENAEITGNTLYWIRTTAFLQSKYYWTFHIFSNVIGNLLWTNGSDSWLDAGTDWALGMADGVLDTSN